MRRKKFGIDGEIEKRKGSKRDVKRTGEWEGMGGGKDAPVYPRCFSNLALGKLRYRILLLLEYITPLYPQENKTGNPIARLIGSVVPVLLLCTKMSLNPHEQGSTSFIP